MLVGLLGIALTFALGLPLVLVAHESGHALAAIAVGFRVFRVEIGSDEPLWTTTAGGTEIVLGRPSFRGRVSCAPRSLDGFRWRKAAIALAGPLASAAVALMAGAMSVRFPFGSVPWVLCWLFASLNAIELVNLVPSSRRPTDGGNARRALRATEAELRQIAIAAMTAELTAHLAAGRTERAMALSHVLARVDPDGAVRALLREVSQEGR